MSLCINARAKLADLNAEKREMETRYEQVQGTIMSRSERWKTTGKRSEEEKQEDEVLVREMADVEMKIELLEAKIAAVEAHDCINQRTCPFVGGGPEFRQAPPAPFWDGARTIRRRGPTDAGEMGRAPTSPEEDARLHEMTEELRRDSERLATLQDRREHLEGMLADLQQGGDGGEGGQGGQ